MKIEGSPKAYSRTPESGRAIGSYFCPECGSRMCWEHPLDAGQNWDSCRCLCWPVIPAAGGVFMPHKQRIAPTGACRQS